MKRLLRVAVVVAVLLALLIVAPIHLRASLPASDNFTRANSGSLGANWTENVHGLQIASNLAVPVTVDDATFQLAIWNPDTPGNDQCSSATLATSNSNYAGPTTRITNTGASTTGYWAACRDATVGSSRLWLITGGVPVSDVATFDCGTVTAGDVVQVTASGTTFVVKKNGSTLLTTTDATYGSGSAGIGEFGGNTNTPSISLWQGNTGSSCTGGGGGAPTCTLALLGVGRCWR